MKTCKNCGASINEDSRFCTQCGADTFAETAQDQSEAFAEASAQPATDIPVDGEEYYRPEGGTPVSDGDYYQPENSAPVSGGDYYQPVGDTNAAPGSTSTYTYAVPTDQTPVGKGKKKHSVWAIIVAVVIVLGVIVRVGIGALGLFGDVAGNLSTISEGYETSTAYINSSINLKIDASKGGMTVLSDSEKKDYFNINPDSYETFIYDMDTDEYIYVMIAEGSLAESAQSISKFAKEIAEYVYEGESNYTIGDTYELEIAGNKFTCVDVAQTVEDDPYYGTYHSEQTFCFIKNATTFLEISITTYPEETGNHAKDIIDQYFSTAK